jgi:hypothetical protein
MANRKGVRYKKPPLIEALWELHSQRTSIPSNIIPITVQPPPKRVLASMRVELLSKDFKRRLPKPVISLESEVEP